MRAGSMRAGSMRAGSMHGSSACGGSARCGSARGGDGGDGDGGMARGALHGAACVVVDVMEIDRRRLLALWCTDDSHKAEDKGQVERSEA
eukprot:6183282-Pleurochrysis_carterae.AAC.1